MTASKEVRNLLGLNLISLPWNQQLNQEEILMLSLKKHFPEIRIPEVKSPHYSVLIGKIGIRLKKPKFNSERACLKVCLEGRESYTYRTIEMKNHQINLVHLTKAISDLNEFDDIQNYNKSYLKSYEEKIDPQGLNTKNLMKDQGIDFKMHFTCDPNVKLTDSTLTHHYSIHGAFTEDENKKLLAFFHQMLENRAK
jgi:hypothetical protein